MQGDDHYRSSNDQSTEVDLELNTEKWLMQESGECQ